jgi:hypothetical protein
MPMPPPEDLQYLDLADYLLLAGAALDRAPEAVFDIADLGLAESALHAPAAAYGGVEFYPDLVTKARVLVVHLTKNHPLPDGNKRAAYLAMIEFLARNGRRRDCLMRADRERRACETPVRISLGDHI